MCSSDLTNAETFMKKRFLLAAAAAMGMAGGARGDILMAFTGASPAGPGEWLYEYEVQLVGGGSLNPGDPFYDTGLFTLFDIEGYVPGSAAFSTYGNAEFYLSVGDVDGQGDAPDIQGSYPDSSSQLYVIAEGDYVGALSFLSTSGRQADGFYYSYADQEGSQYEVLDGPVAVPAFVPPTQPVPETSTVLSAGVLGLLGGGYLVRRRMAAKAKA